MSEQSKELSRVSNPFEAQDNKVSFSPKDFLVRYIRYLPWILVSMVVFLVMAYIKIRYTIPIYRVQSSLLIKNENDQGGAGGGKEISFNDLFMNQGSVNLSNEIEILRSRPVLQRVARDLDLQRQCYNKGSIRSSLQYETKPFNLVLHELADSTMGFGFQVNMLNDQQFLLNEGKTPYRFGQPFHVGNNICELIRNLNAGLHLFPARTFQVGWQPLAQAAGEITGGLKVTQANDQATILLLSFEGENRILGGDVLNTLMAVYDSLIVEDKSRIAFFTLRFIDERLNNLRDELGSVQGNLKDYMVANQAYNIEDQSKGYLDNLSAGAKEKAVQEIRLNVINWLLDYIQNSKNMYNAVPTILGIEEPALLQLITEYNRLQLEHESNLKTTTPSNPLIVSLEASLEKVRTNIHQALLNVRQAYLIANKNLDEQESRLQGRIQGLPGKSMDLLNISRRQKILEDLYSFLLQKKLETSISSASTISNSKVVEPAIGSDVPISPDKKKIYVFYLLFGIFLPTGIIALIEVMRDKVRNRADVEKYTRAPILGEIGHSSNEQTLVVTKNNRHFISEQFRIIRTNLQYVIAKKEKPVIMVTSSFSGEGKSFISTNIAAVMALAGKKTVIMEFDIRKPKIVSGLDLKRKMGITNYIIGRASFDDLLVKVDEVDNLYVIPCGPIPPNPAELLIDPLLDDLMKEVIRRFDVVIMDTAPIGLVSDAMNLSRYADCTLYIIRQGHTFRKQLHMVDELYSENKLPKLSLLLNDVKAEGGYYGGYGYGYYGGYSYGMDSGYFETDKDQKKGGLFGSFGRWWRKLFS
ncbi:MAG TPA: polysaccharide biosynthesis tyrosine autokinase [Puia sp.]|jgi:capsular exopolysaccharide synthesis family protein